MRHPVLWPTVLPVVLFSLRTENLKPKKTPRFWSSAYVWPATRNWSHTLSVWPSFTDEYLSQGKCPSVSSDKSSVSDTNSPSLSGISQRVPQKSKLFSSLLNVPAGTLFSRQQPRSYFLKGGEMCGYCSAEHVEEEMAPWPVFYYASIEF